MLRSIAMTNQARLIQVAARLLLSLAFSAAFYTSTSTSALAQSAAPSWTFCANQRAFCSFSGTRQVRYGANGQYIVKTITANNGGTACTNKVFGNPIRGVRKRCEVDASATPALTPVIESFNAAPKTISAGGTATLSWSVGNATGVDIDNGVGNVSGSQVNVSPTSTTTYRLTARNANGTSQRTITVAVIANPSPPPAQVPTISGFTASPASIVSGASSTLMWSVSNATSVSITPNVGAVTGASVIVQPAQTTQYILNATNAQGSVQATVTVAVDAAAPPPDHSGMGPYIDRNKIPSGEQGVSVDRVSSTSEQPAASDGTGVFRTVCGFSHMNFDDPIVYPGRPGAAHLHAFFGNTGTNANSTEESIRTTGNATCRGGTINRSAYWVPALIDTRDGTPVKPQSSHFYYKTGYRGVAPRDVQPFPQGLRMIAGSASSSGPQPDAARWKCVDGGDNLVGSSIQNCPAGAELWQEIFFPQCWDGKNLDSPDHKSHMAYPSRGCPSTHPVALPEISFNIVYKVAEANAPLRWRLSSDMYPADQPGGYSSHGDWINGWKQEMMETWVQYCDQLALDCHSHLLGNGLKMD